MCDFWHCNGQKHLIVLERIIFFKVYSYFKWEGKKSFIFSHSNSCHLLRVPLYTHNRQLTVVFFTIIWLEYIFESNTVMNHDPVNNTFYKKTGENLSTLCKFYYHNQLLSLGTHTFTDSGGYSESLLLYLFYKVYSRGIFHFLCT